MSDILNLVWAEEPGISVCVYQPEREDRRVIEICKGDLVLGRATIANHNRDNLAESIATGELRYSSEEVARLVRAATTQPEREVRE